MQKFISIEPMDPGTVHESTGLLQPDRVAPDNEIFSTHSSSSSTKEALASLSPAVVGAATKASNSDSASEDSSAFFSSPKSPKPNTGAREPVVFSPFVLHAEAPIVTTQIDTPLTLSVSDVYNPPAAVSVSGIPIGVVNTSKSREMRANKEPKSIRK